MWNNQYQLVTITFNKPAANRLGFQILLTNERSVESVVDQWQQSFDDGLIEWEWTCGTIKELRGQIRDIHACSIDASTMQIADILKLF